jgi:hypothetical protein
MPYRDDVEALRMLRDRIAGDLEEARRSETEARQLAQQAAQLEDELAEVDQRLALHRSWSRGPRGLRCGPPRPLQIVTLIALVHGLLALGAILSRPHPISSPLIPQRPAVELSVDERLFFAQVPARPAVPESFVTDCNPFYFLDSDGNPRVKPECLFELPAESARH